MNSFSFQRWSLLVGKHWVENKKRYLLSVVAIFALLIFYFTFSQLANGEGPMDRGVQIIGYFLGLFGIGCLYAGQFFSPLGSRSKGAFYLLTPASALEKLLCALLYVVVFFFVVYTAVYYLADLIMIAVANNLHPFYAGSAIRAVPINVFYEYNWGLGDANLMYYFILAFFAVQSAFLLGSIYFSQYGVVKTAIVLFIGFLALAFLEGYLLHKLLPNGDHHNGLSDFVSYLNGKPDKMVQLSPLINDVLFFLSMYCVAPFLWLVTYFRLTEKEI
jgi:hypothetical protein